jgi:hypothetical protein
VTLTLSASTKEQIRRDDRAHVFHSWSAQALIDPLPIASASGSYFTDYDGTSTAPTWFHPAPSVRARRATAWQSSTMPSR